MRLRALHQFVPTFEPGAVGAHIVEVQKLAREVLGVPSEVFAEHVHPAMQGAGRRHSDYGRAVRARPGDVLVYHLAIGSGVADFVCARREPLVVDHHNVTPPELLEPWDPAAAYGCAWGRAQLPALARRATLGLADSAYNEDELRRAGCARTATAPILLDTAALRGAADPAVLARLREAKAGGGADWLFVGRVSPNKCHHDVVRAFAAYRRLYDPRARLHFVGGSSSPAYSQALEACAGVLGLAGAVTLTGPVSAGELHAYYEEADVFVCLSEHEGFGIPLLEALAHDVAVVAFASSAVPATLGDAGVLLANKAPATVAAAVHRVVSDEALRAKLRAAGARRLEAFAYERTRARWVELLESVDASPPSRTWCRSGRWSDQIGDRFARLVR